MIRNADDVAWRAVVFYAAARIAFDQDMSAVDRHPVTGVGGCHVSKGRGLPRETSLRVWPVGAAAGAP